ncbi:hypothetical protein ACFOVU_18925 [Nocardiopsis sediminis]|uniref:Uncharacterized protein n=1 Tax=Nocardiopsis sediminis TaxID=1778267 RepID=A0ABV8FTF9_9ACTN
MRILTAVAAVTAACAAALAGAAPAAGAADDDLRFVVVREAAYRYQSEDTARLIEDPEANGCRSATEEVTAEEARAIGVVLPDTEAPVTVREIDCTSGKPGEGAERLKVVFPGDEPVDWPGWARRVIAAD